MNIRPQDSRRAGRAERAFTLIELLVVVFVIALLGLALVWFLGFIRTDHPGRDAQVRARINELSNGCVLYRSDTNYYPGQQNLDCLAGANPMTGSQILAEALFIDYSDTSWDNANGKGNHSAGANRSQWHWKSNYAPLNYGIVRSSTPAQTTPRCDLMTSCPDPAVSAAVGRKPFCVSDQFSTNQLPILYYPSHPLDADGKPTTGRAQFHESDNSVYLAPSVFSGWKPEDSSDPANFANFIGDKRDITQDVPYRSGEFLLIGADRDRMYGTRGTVKNWSD